MSSGVPVSLDTCLESPLLQFIRFSLMQQICLSGYETLPRVSVCERNGAPTAAMIRKRHTEMIS